MSPISAYAMNPRSKYVMDLFEAGECGVTPQALTCLAMQWRGLSDEDRQGAIQGLETWVREVVEAHIRMALFDAVEDGALSAYGRSYLHKTACLLSMCEHHPQYETTRDELDAIHERLTAAEVDACRALISEVTRSTAT